MNELVLDHQALPGIYQSADQASMNAQRSYYMGLGSYLWLLIIAASVSFFLSKTGTGAYLSTALFLITLGILIYLRVRRPDQLWYNSRVVAETVKTKAWRFCMRADPYKDWGGTDEVSKQFIDDMKLVFDQYRNLPAIMSSGKGIEAPISETMINIRQLSFPDRLELYKIQRIDDQADWYSKKAAFNERRANLWFWTSVFFHGLAIGFLLYGIGKPHISLPVQIAAIAASAVLTWLQAKKHNELNSSYTLAALEIGLIKGKALSIKTEEELADFVYNSEAAFSREHTKWAA